MLYGYTVSDKLLIFEGARIALDLRQTHFSLRDVPRVYPQSNPKRFSCYANVLGKQSFPAERVQRLSLCLKPLRCLMGGVDMMSLI